jgi:hypothetical protein
MNSSARLRELVEAKATGRSWDVVGVVDGLFGIAAEVGAITCTLARTDGLRFLLGGQPPCEVDLDLAPSKLRTMCARLGVLCNEGSGEDVSLYGGEATFDYGPPGQQRKWRVRFQNTPAEHEFTIQAQ